MKVYKKLVRDNIPDIMILNRATPVVRTLNDEEYISELNKKLKEEVNEYLKSNDVLELVDIEEVILAILKYKNISIEDFETRRKEKVLKRGAFEKRIYLEKEE